MNLPALDDPCGKYFIYRDLIECSDTWKATEVDNTPKSINSYRAMRDMCTEVLDPIQEELGEIRLTYGFSSPALVKEIKKNNYPNITPDGDQHAAWEVNQNGKPICRRLGIAVDFYVAGVSSLVVAQWIVKNTNFDRLYFYSPHRPLHVSVGPENNQAIVWMRGYRGGRHQPIVQSVENFMRFSEEQSEQI